MNQIGLLPLKTRNIEFLQSLPVDFVLTRKEGGWAMEGPNHLLWTASSLSELLTAAEEYVMERGWQALTKGISV